MLPLVLKIVLFNYFVMGLESAVCDISNYPYFVNIRDAKSKMCGGVLVHEWWVLTTGNCVKSLGQSEDVTFVVGTNNLNDFTENVEVSKVKYYKLHPNFKASPTGYEHNIALYRLKEKVEITYQVNLHSLKEHDPFCGEGVVIGFGIEMIDFKAGENSIEAKFFHDKLRCISILLNKCGGNLCVNDNQRRLCSGYEGSPLICHGQIAGLLTGGDDCDKVKGPVIFTKVRDYIEWIVNIIEAAKAAGEDVEDKLSNKVRAMGEEANYDSNRAVVTHSFFNHGVMTLIMIVMVMLLE